MAAATDPLAVAAAVANRGHRQRFAGLAAGMGTAMAVVAAFVLEVAVVRVLDETILASHRPAEHALLAPLQPRANVRLVEHPECDGMPRDFQVMNLGP